MKMKQFYLLTVITLIGLVSTSSPAQGTAFTYQGRLDSGGAPFNGSAEFQATLWTAAAGGTQVAANNPAAVVVGVTNGLFTLPLDFGAQFPGGGPVAATGGAHRHWPVHHADPAPTDPPHAVCAYGVRAFGFVAGESVDGDVVIGAVGGDVCEGGDVQQRGECFQW